MATLVDTTLRDGEQAPGASFSYLAKLRIARLLRAMGVDEIEIRSPVHDPVLFHETCSLLSEEPQVDWLVWCRARAEDIEAAFSCGARRIHIAYPTSDLQLATLDTSWERALSYLEPLVRQAVRQFSFVSMGAQDAGRTSWERLITYGHALQSWGVQRLRIADTLGLMSPFQVSSLMVELRTHISGLPLEFHGHNDLGMATANAFAALSAGADAASATVLGIGERAGNASLEQLAMALHQHHPGLLPNIHTEEIANLTLTVAEFLRMDIPSNQPIVGQSTRRHQSGIHIAGMLKDPHSYQPFDPALVGCGPALLEVGPLAGRHALRHALNQAGICPQESALDTLLLRAKDAMRQRRQILSTEELATLYQES